MHYIAVIADIYSIGGKKVSEFLYFSILDIIFNYNGKLHLTISVNKLSKHLSMIGYKYITLNIQIPFFCRLYNIYPFFQTDFFVLIRLHHGSFTKYIYFSLLFKLKRTFYIVIITVFKYSLRRFNFII